MAIKNLDRITADYERMWNDSRLGLRDGHIQPDPVPGNDSRRWGVSVVMRPVGTSLSRLAEGADDLNTLAGDRQVVYGPSNLHTTLRSIEFYRTDVDELDEKVCQYKSLLQDVLRDFGPFRMTYKGLTSDGTSIMAQGWPADDALQQFRETLHAELDKQGLLGGPERTAIRQTSHASLIVFTRPLAAAKKVTDYVRQNRSTDYGNCEIGEAQLVRYRRTESDVRLDVFASFPTGKS